MLLIIHCSLGFVLSVCDCIAVYAIGSTPRVKSHIYNILVHASSPSRASVGRSSSEDDPAIEEECMKLHLGDIVKRLLHSVSGNTSH